MCDAVCAVEHRCAFTAGAPPSSDRDMACEDTRRRTDPPGDYVKSQMSWVRSDGERSGVMGRVLPKAAIKLRPRDAKPARRLRFVACAFAQCLFDRLSLEALQIRADERRRIVAIRQR